MGWRVEGLGGLGAWGYEGYLLMRDELGKHALVDKEQFGGFFFFFFWFFEYTKVQ